MSAHLTWQLLALAQAGAAVLSVSHRQTCRWALLVPDFTNPKAWSTTGPQHLRHPGAALSIARPAQAGAALWLEGAMAVQQGQRVCWGQGLHLTSSRLSHRHWTVLQCPAHFTQDTSNPDLRPSQSPTPDLLMSTVLLPPADLWPAVVAERGALSGHTSQVQNQVFIFIRNVLGIKTIMLHIRDHHQTPRH